MEHFKNNFLFSETYLRELLRQEKHNKGEQVSAVFNNVKQWNVEYTSGDYRNDPWVDYISAVLDVLGFRKRHSQKNSNTILLYTNTISEKSAPVAICLPVDKDQELSSAVKGRYYAYQAIEGAKINQVKWAMITNGRRWRIYNTDNISPFENYLEVDLESSISEGESPTSAFYLFYRIFHSMAYYAEDGTFIIDRLKGLSDEKAESMEDLLRGKAESILTELCYGLKDDMRKEAFTEAERSHIYNDAIILLYRLLFFGYAESRGLLPAVKDDSSYTDSFYGLSEEAKELINSGEFPAQQDSYEFWERLDNHLRIYVDNTYNGGLFSNTDKPLLKEHRIKNRFLVPCLAELSFIKDSSGRYSNRIEYKDLTVRNLGSIYEGLLDYQLFIAEERMVQRKTKGSIKYIPASQITLKTSDLNNIIERGGIYLSQDATERKDSGSYYTPEDVVGYIVDSTVGKKMEELKEKLDSDLAKHYEALSYEPTETGRRIIRNTIDEITKRFIEQTVLKTYIIDSAMGSGHFLVNAAYRVANEVVDMISKHNWESDIDLPVNVSYWKRKVVENCIYGIDINGLAVALARLSLWLISASNNEALSFIDHHLKEGDSIIGTDRKHVEYTQDKKSNSIFDVSFERFMEPILTKYKQIGLIGSKTKEDVERQKELYEEIERELELVRRKYDYYLASQYLGGIDDRIRYSEVMYAKDMTVFEDGAISSLVNYAKSHKFFHWELEFPEVISSGGFDVAIGNPPYVEVKGDNYQHSVPSVLDTRNLYAYIMSRNLQYLKPEGKLSFIVLMAAIASKKMKSLRKKLLDVQGKVSFMNIDSATYPGRLFKGLMIRVTIITVEKQPNKNNTIHTTNYKRFFQHERKDLFKDVEYRQIDKSIMVNSKDLIIPKVGDEIQYSILDKMSKKTTLSLTKFCSNKGNSNVIFFRNTGAVYYCMAFDTPPYYTVNGVQKVSSTLTPLALKKASYVDMTLCLFHSSLFYWYWTVYSDCYHFTKNDLFRFPIDLEELSEGRLPLFRNLSDEIKQSLNENKAVVRYKKSFGDLEYDEFKHRRSKHVFDKVDYLLGDYYGFSDKELLYIVNYDYKYRVGD